MGSLNSWWMRVAGEPWLELCSLRISIHSRGITSIRTSFARGLERERWVPTWSRSLLFCYQNVRLRSLRRSSAITRRFWGVPSTLKEACIAFTFSRQWSPRIRYFWHGVRRNFSPLSLTTSGLKSSSLPWLPQVRTLLRIFRCTLKASNWQCLTFSDIFGLGKD